MAKEQAEEVVEKVEEVVEKVEEKAEEVVEKVEEKEEGNDWADQRVKIADGDEKLQKYLERYGTQAEALRGGHEANKKISEGLKAKGEPGEDATEGEVMDYRKANDIPEKAADYKLKLGDGVVIGDEDQPIVDSFLEIAHKHNISTGKASAIVAGQLEIKDKMVEERRVADVQFEIANRDELTSEAVWGRETKQNLNMINAFLDTAPAEVKELVQNARGGDGNPLGSNAKFLRWMNTTARKLNPLGTVTPNAGTTALDTVRAEIDKLDMLMGDKSSEYWKGDKADGHQNRYRELIEMREKNKDLKRS